MTDVVAVYSGLHLQSAQGHALSQAEIHYTHEVDALLNIAQQRRLYIAAVGGISDFVNYQGHRCTSTECELITAPAAQRVFACPAPDEHPIHKRNTDGSVLHMWSGVVSVCFKYGVPHTCTLQMCSHQELIDGQLICKLTGRVLGVPIASVTELPYVFDGGKAMTAATLQLADQGGIDTRMQQYYDGRAENQSRSAQLVAAKEDATVIAELGLKRDIDTSGLSCLIDGSRTAGPFGLIELPQRS